MFISQTLRGYIHIRQNRRLPGRSQEEGNHCQRGVDKAHRSNRYWEVCGPKRYSGKSAEEKDAGAVPERIRKIPISLKK